MAIPMTLPLSFNANSSSLGTLNNAGNVEAFPSIIITGPLEDPVLTNETNGQSMNLTYALTTSAEFIVIDTILRTVLYYADVDTAPVNIRSAMTGDFITLSPGDNIVKLVVANFADGNAQLAWRDSYSGL
jgi:phage-related protein